MSNNNSRFRNANHIKFVNQKNQMVNKSLFDYQNNILLVLTMYPLK